MCPHRSQSPAVKEILVTLVKVAEVIATARTSLEITSPTFPAPVLSFVVVPTMPPVVGLNVILVAVAAPNVGVMKVGEVENTRLVLVVPVDPAAVYPVILLKAVMLAELTLVPPLATGNTPVTPVVIGKPVQLVKVPLVGVPNSGVVKEGEVENTRLVLVVPVAPAAVYPVMLLKAVILAEDALVPPLATGSTPVTPEVKGSPVAFVRVPEAGVPNTGVTNSGLVANTNAPDPVSSVTKASRLALEGVVRKSLIAEGKSANAAVPLPVK